MKIVRRDSRDTPSLMAQSFAARSREADTESQYSAHRVWGDERQPLFSISFLVHNWLTIFKAEGLGVLLEEGQGRKGDRAMDSLTFSNCILMANFSLLSSAHL